MGKNEYIGAGIFIALGVFIWAVSFQFPILEGRRKSQTPPPPAEDDEGGNVKLIGEKNYFNAVLVIILIAAFIALANHLGFIITGGAVLFILMWKLHVTPLKSFIISAVVMCMIYSVFSKGLRVPLPHGFLWW